MPDDLSSAWPPPEPAPRPTAPPAQPVPRRWRYQPVSSALWRALSMDAPTLAMTLASQSATRLDVLAARAVDLACGGNIKAMALVTDRIEGRVGVRPGEADPASDAAREGVQQAIEEMAATAFTEAKLAQANGTLGEGALDITPSEHPVPAPNGEHPRSVLDDEPAPRRPAVN